MSLYDALARFFGTVAVGAPPEPVPLVHEDEDAELELTAEELAEAELATATWPFKELSANLQARYGDGEKPPEVGDELQRLAAAGYARAAAADGQATPIQVTRGSKLDEPSGKVKQECETPHAERLGEILRKVKELQRPK